MTHRSESRRRAGGPWGATLIVALLFLALLSPRAIVYGFYLVSFVSADIWDKLTALF